MNIVFLIGNGFDLNLGLKTSYKDFYKYYMKVKSSSDIVNQMKNTISKDYNTWKDLELGLGEYTGSLYSQEEFNEVISDIRKELSTYLNRVEKRFKVERVDRDKFYDCISHTEKYLLPYDARRINGFKSTWIRSDWNVSIITFNYTTILEKIIGEFNMTDLKIGTHHTSKIKLQSLNHVHGYVDNRMILGVNDTSQILNKSFIENEEVLDALVKDRCNKANKLTINNICAQSIGPAQLICLFGSSIGETDTLWWELVGERLKKDVMLIIFHKCDPIKPRDAYLQKKEEDAMINTFFNRTRLDEKDRIGIKHKICVCINSSMFDLIEKKKRNYKIKKELKVTNY